MQLPTCNVGIAVHLLGLMTIPDDDRPRALRTFCYALGWLRLTALLAARVPVVSKIISTACKRNNVNWRRDLVT